MANVSIVQPKIGNISVVSQTSDEVTVRWNCPEGVDADFVEFKLYCEACGGTLVTIDDNPATFDIKKLVDEGHPGTFDISAVIVGHGDVYVYTDVAEGIGRTITWPDGTKMSEATDSFYAEVEVGSSLLYYIRAYPGVGWAFDKWTKNGDDTTYSSYQSIRLNKNTTEEYSVDYEAYFSRKSNTLYCSIFTDGSRSTTRPLGGTVNGLGEDSRNLTIGKFDYETSVRLVASPKPGYKFVRWEVYSGATEGEGPHKGDIYNGLEWTIKMPSENTRIYAYFETADGNLLYGSSDSLIYGNNDKLVYEG